MNNTTSFVEHTIDHSAAPIIGHSTEASDSAPSVVVE